MSIQLITNVRITGNMYEISVTSDQETKTLTVPVTPSSVDLNESWESHLKEQGVEDSSVIVNVLRAFDQANLALAAADNPRAAAYQKIVQQDTSQKENS